MHIERVVFDTVFDAQAGRGDFSFTSKGQAHYGVNLSPGTIPLAGDTWLVAFGVAGDWSTVLGWRDLRTDTVRLRAPTWHALVAGLDALVWYGPFFVFGVLLVAGAGAELAVLLALCFFCGWLLVTNVRRNRAVRQALARAEGSGPRQAHRLSH